MNPIPSSLPEPNPPIPAGNRIPASDPHRVREFERMLQKESSGEVSLTASPDSHAVLPEVADQSFSPSGKPTPSQAGPLTGESLSASPGSLFSGEVALSAARDHHADLSEVADQSSLTGKPTPLQAGTVTGEVTGERLSASPGTEIAGEVSLTASPDSHAVLPEVEADQSFSPSGKPMPLRAGTVTGGVTGESLSASPGIEILGEAGEVNAHSLSSKSVVSQESLSGSDGTKSTKGEGKDSGNEDALTPIQTKDQSRDSSCAQGISPISGEDRSKQADRDSLVPCSGFVQPPQTPVTVQTAIPAENNSIHALERIQQIADLISQAAQSVTFVGNERADVTLSPTQLPDSKIRVELQQGVMQVVFTSDNASSMALLQGRGGELAAALALRFDREIRVEIRGGVSSDPDSQVAESSSWVVQRRSSGDSGGTLDAGV